MALRFITDNSALLVRTRKLRKSLPLVETAQEDFDRASEVLEGLARHGQHRSARIPDLIANVTGQGVEWIVPAGSVP